MDQGWGGPAPQQAAVVAAGAWGGGVGRGRRASAAWRRRGRGQEGRVCSLHRCISPTNGAAACCGYLRARGGGLVVSMAIISHWPLIQSTKQHQHPDWHSILVVRPP